MRLRADLSFYPLAADYKPPIKDLISRLEARREIEVSRNDLSTQIAGAYDEVMRAVAEETKTSFETNQGVLVAKFVCAGGE